MIRAFPAIVFLGFSAGWAGAVTLVSSGFGSGNDGWRVGEFGGGGPDPVAAVDVAIGGNPGGFLRTSDIYQWNAYVAPAEYLGNKGAAYGGSLHVEQRIADSDDLTYPMVILADDDTVLQFRTLPPAVSDSWTTYDIPLLASAGWEIANFSFSPGTPATEQQFRLVLSNLKFMMFEADWHSGDDQVDMDNVRIESGVGFLPGDANLDGRIDPDDYALTDRGFRKGLSGWVNGDFNNDTVVNAADYTILDQSFAQHGGGTFSPGTLGTAVPEPGSSAGVLLATGAVGLRRRGRVAG